MPSAFLQCIGDGSYVYPYEGGAKLLPNGSGNNSLFIGRSSKSHNERQNRVLILGGTIWVLSFVVGSVGYFANGNGNTYPIQGLLLMVQALLQTIGAMVVAATDADLDIFAKKHPRSAFTFALAWILVYTGLGALAPPVQAINQVFWLPALPFAYLLLRFTPVLHMRDKIYPRFSDLLVYSLVLVLGRTGAYYFLYGIIYDGPQGNITWPDYLLGTLFVLGGTLVFGIYWYSRDNYSRRMALSTTLYAYLLAFGVCYLAAVLVNQYANSVPIPLIEYAFAIIHIAFPLAYFLFSSLVYPHLARHWLQQRSANADSIAQEQSIAPYHGDLAAVKEAISTGIDLNAHIEHEHNAADEFTLLILACFNCHEDAVDLLLSHDEVQVNKGSRRQHWTPLYVAAMVGNTLSVGKLIVRGANVHVKTEDQQSALLAATTFGHTQIVQQLMEAGAHKDEAWMGVDASAAAEELGRVSIVVSMRSYESHFQGHIRKVQGCACVASWPGIYSKSWDYLVAQGKESKVSAAVVFLPQDTLHYGKCGSDKCYCVEMYGEKKDWGCKWFQLWREHITKAVSLNQRLQVFFFEGLVGKGKIEPTSTMTAWKACCADSIRRDKLYAMKGASIQSLLPQEKTRLDELSSETRDDSMGEAPGSERGDEEERLFLASLSEEDRRFYEGHKGLGNSQKAEVAWLEEMEYAYEELDVRDFVGGRL